jgi:hypothetical protein
LESQLLEIGIASLQTNAECAEGVGAEGILTHILRSVRSERVDELACLMSHRAVRLDDEGTQLKAVELCNFRELLALQGASLVGSNQRSPLSGSGLQRSSPGRACDRHIHVDAPIVLEKEQICMLSPSL